MAYNLNIRALVGTLGLDSAGRILLTGKKGTIGFPAFEGPSGSMEMRSLKGTIAFSGGGSLALTGKSGTIALSSELDQVHEDIALTAIQGRIALSGTKGSTGSCDMDALQSVLSLSGFDSTSGTLALDSLIGELSIGGWASAVGSTTYVNLPVVVCLDNFAVSEYKDFPYTSIAEVDGIIYVTGHSGGLYKLTPGATDNGANLDAYFETCDDPLARTYFTTLTDVYLSYKYGPAKVTVMKEGAEVGQHDIPASGSELTTKRVAKGLEKGVRSRLTSVKVLNHDGSRMSIDMMILKAFRAISRRLHKN